jgi:Protein of unknown function (DUF992)
MAGRLAGLAVAMLWAFSLGAGTASADVALGVLTCTLAEGEAAAPGDAPVASQKRDALCTFMAKSGVEETYIGKFQGVTTTPSHNKALMWVVKSASGSAAHPGLLQQTYTADPAKPADHKSPIIGEVNADIQLQTMADENEGNASVSEKPPPRGFVVIGVELKLTSSAG